MIEAQRAQARAARETEARIRAARNEARNEIRQTLVELDVETNYSTATLLRILNLEEPEDTPRDK